MDRNYAEEMAYCEGDVMEIYGNLPEKWKNQKSKPIERKKEVVYWELRDGEKVDIDKMSEQHLRNVLKLIVTKSLLKDKM